MRLSTTNQIVDLYENKNTHLILCTFFFAQLLTASQLGGFRPPVYQFVEKRRPDRLLDGRKIGGTRFRSAVIGKPVFVLPAGDLGSSSGRVGQGVSFPVLWYSALRTAQTASCHRFHWKALFRRAWPCYCWNTSAVSTAAILSASFRKSATDKEGVTVAE
jgi:hypothetical protein